MTRPWTGALLLVMAASPLAAQAGSRARVRAAELERFDAQIKRDTMVLKRLLGEDLIYVHSNGLTESKAHFIETVATGRIQYDSLVPVKLEHRVYGTTAVGNGRVHVQVEMGGQTVKVDLLFTTVLLERKGKWELISWQSTRAPD
ncbi:MAG: nuclear transport factor 2 family protein [Gemmatimonadota bacterium]